MLMEDGCWREGTWVTFCDPCTGLQAYPAALGLGLGLGRACDGGGGRGASRGIQGTRAPCSGMRCQQGSR